MEKKKEVLFDPGFAPLVIDSIGGVGYTYYMFSAIPNFKLKKMNFPHTLSKINKLLKTNVSFYLGCLMWACYIKQFEGAQIIGNKLLGEDAKEEEYTKEINFLIDFMEKDLPKDCKYYQNKPYEIDSRYIKILKNYREFLIINRGFVDCSNTNQIKLPKDIKKELDLDLINEKIENAINNKNIDALLDYYELIFD